MAFKYFIKKKKDRNYHKTIKGEINYLSKNIKQCYHLYIIKKLNYP